MGDRKYCFSEVFGCWVLDFGDVRPKHKLRG